MEQVGYSCMGPEVFGDTSRLSQKGHKPSSARPFAVQVVHLRTFGTAAKEGGTAFHMLLPLVDFLNHGGDETECLPSDRFAPTANVRCEALIHPH